MRIIAEVGSNHTKLDGERSLERAKKLIFEAAHSGATHVKFQLYTPEKMYRHPPEKMPFLPYAWVPQLKEECDKEGVEFLCTPFDLDAVNYLSDFVKEWKIASGCIDYFPLLRAIARTGKPAILSTGACTKEEIVAAIDVLRPEREGLDTLCILHCHPEYPTMPEDANLSRIIDLAGILDEYPIEVGLSSHVKDPYINAAAAMYMATTFEAHFDLSDKEGVEASWSLTPREFEEMVRYIYRFRKNGIYGQIKDGIYVDSFEITPAAKRERIAARFDPSDWKRPLLKDTL